MSSPSPSKKRMDNDVIKLVRNYPVTLVDGFNQFIVRFSGPTETPYEGGVWNVRVELPDTYPFKSPSIGFINKIFHPNIDEASGTVCLDVINQTWTALYELSNVFDVFLPQLLKYPNADDPLNSAAATMYIHHPEEYANKVREYVQKFACEKVINNGKENGRDKDENNDNGQSDESSMSDFDDDEAQDMDI